MSKKQKKEKSGDMLYQIDSTLNHRFEAMKLEVEFYQKEIDRGERKERRRALGKMKKKNTFYVIPKNVSARERVIRQMEGNNFIERVFNLLQELGPLVRVLAELVKSLIVAILSIDSVKYRISKRTMSGFEQVYGLADALCAAG